ncbi:MAG: DNA repair protein RecO [Gemmataceae bacterium]|nr:DNA repair protein RecO [Gemmataceae bacterium]
MPAEKALALVVRGTDWSETSRITTLFTREFGKVRGLAKGGRRLKSSFEVAFDLLTVCRVVFLRKASGGLDLLTEAQLAEQFPALRRDLHALNAGYYVAELLADGTQDYDPHPDLFDAALGALRGLGEKAGDPSPGNQKTPPPNPLPRGERGDQRGGRSSSPPPWREGPGEGSSRASRGRVLAAVSAFELVWLKELGYSPRLDECTGCGAAPVGDRVFVSPAAGGVVCPACGPAALDRRPLSAAGLNALRGLVAGADPGSLPAAAGAELRPLLGLWVSTVLGRRPRLLGYVDGPGR